MKKFKIKDNNEEPHCSYSEETFGIDEIYLERNAEETLIFVNHLALSGMWIDSHQLEKILRI